VNELIKLDIPAKAEYVVLGRLALAGILRDRGYTADAVADLKLALTEACSNCIRHAYDGSTGQVHLRFSVREDRVVLEVRDDGSGFHEEDDGPALETIGKPEPSEGGMGISIIRSVVDEFRLDRPSKGGTTLILTKLRDT
jgi:serine/threonine-protein kinase RsbW